MIPSDVAVRPRRSAFAAAFLSFLYPGLGHAYLGRWLRAFLWALFPTLGIIGLGVYVSGQDLVELGGQVAVDPTPLIVVLIVDFLYRLAAVLDAWRLAKDPSVGSAGTRMLSAAGLVALVVVLIASHVVVGSAGLTGNSILNDITSGSGDDSEVPDADVLAAENPDFVLVYEEQGTQASLEPGASPDPEASSDAGLAPPPGEDANGAEEVAEPEFEEWDGKKRLNILLVGADLSTTRGYSYLTDTMITVSIDPPTGRVAFISLPRDTSGVPLPSSWPASRVLGGKYNNKINTLYTQARVRPDLFPKGSDKTRGFEALMGALGQLYGLDIKYYVAVDIDSFRSVVNTLGGVVIDVQVPVFDPKYPTNDGRGSLKLYFPSGITRMNGQRALAYARSRHGSNDFERSARQQRVITSVRDQTDLASLLEPRVLNDLIGAMRKDVKTNIPPKLVPSLLSLARDIDLDRRENLVLSSAGGYSTTCYPCPPSGLYVLKANVSKIRSAVKNVFSGNRQAARTISRIREEAATVHVLNGYGSRNTRAIDIARRLSAIGMVASVPPVNEGRADSLDYGPTVITVYNGADEAMPETLRRLKRSFKEKNVEVVAADDPEQDADFVVTVGSKTKM
jgi:LCP family protein required for cell wall assembly